MVAPRIVVVDYHKGNLLSVERGLAQHGVEVEVTDDPARIAAAQAAVVPGVGAFDDAMTYMRASGQSDAVLALAAAGRPLLGICLGMQLLFECGCEQAVPAAPGEPDVWTAGLGLLGGKVVRLEGAGVKVPHVGWNAAAFTPQGEKCPLFAGLPSETYFYFTHSYVCAPADQACAIATTEHGQRFVSAVWDGGVTFGTQFHPEKSSEAGQVLMGNFASIVKERA